MILGVRNRYARLKPGFYCGHCSSMRSRPESWRPCHSTYRLIVSSSTPALLAKCPGNHTMFSFQYSPPNNLNFLCNPDDVRLFRCLITNWTYIIMAVDETESEIIRSSPAIFKLLPVQGKENSRISHVNQILTKRLI